MATGATRLARLEERRRGREHARSRRQDRSRDAPLHHFAGSAGPPNRADDPRPLDDRKRPALGVGHGLPRRRMPCADGQRPRQLGHPQAHGVQRHANGRHQRLHASEAQSRRLGRRLPRKPHRRMIFFARFPCVPIDHILSAVEGATRLKLIILDACRTDPFRATSSKRAVARGLAAPETIEVNELVAYSARAGTAAADGDPGAASPYTAALLKRLTTPGLDVELALRRVRDDVLRATHREQEPFYYGSMGGDEF